MSSPVPHIYSAVAGDVDESVERKRGIRCILEIDGEVNRNLRSRSDVAAVGSRWGLDRRRSRRERKKGREVE